MVGRRLLVVGSWVRGVVGSFSLDKIEHTTYNLQQVKLSLVLLQIHKGGLSSRAMSPLALDI